MYNFSDTEILEFISSLDTRAQAAARKALLESEITKISEIGMAYLGETPASGFVVGLGSRSPKPRLWDMVLDQIYSFMCTNSSVYKDEREKGSGAFSSLVAVIASSLASTVSVSVGIISGVVTVALIGISKIGKNAWCELHKATKALDT